MGVKKKTNSHNIKRRSKELGKSKSGAKRGKVQGLEPPGKANGEDEPAARVWQVVAMIPKGKVATYGQIAALIGLPSHARFVGRTLRNLPSGTRLPWHRVVNANLRISQRGGGEQRQKQRLQDEGVGFIGERIASGHRWQP